MYLVWLASVYASVMGGGNPCVDVLVYALSTINVNVGDDVPKRRTDDDEMRAPSKRERCAGAEAFIV